MPNPLDKLYNRFDPVKNYDSHLFLAGRNLQSAELNEIQSAAARRVRTLTDILFKDGDIVRDAAIIVDVSTGEVTCTSGAVYISGAIRGVAPASFFIPVDEVVAVGLYQIKTVVSELEDQQLRDPATSVLNYQQPGALREKIEAVWGFPGDGRTDEFYPVYTVDNGVVRSKEPPPNFDAVTQALARYDRDSSGGSYIVSGLSVITEADTPNAQQVYTVSEGRARVNGYGVELKASRRLVYPAAPDLRLIDSEPHISISAGAQRVTLDRSPIGTISSVHITTTKTVSLSHGGFVGAQDPLPGTSVLAISSVSQGATTYKQNVDYKLTAGKVDWSLSGVEVAPGSTYSVTYQYIVEVVPTLVDATGFTVSGAVVGSLILVDYTQKLPRIDRLILTPEGELVWAQGVSAEYNAQPPTVPSGSLSLASVLQTWSADRRVFNDAVRVVPMTDLAAIGSKLDRILGLVAQQRLESNIHTRESGTKKGLFTDPFRDESQRDIGQVQNAAIVNGELTLPVVTSTAQYVSADIAAPATISFVPVETLSQTARTGSMNVNPYLSFAPIPANVSLVPNVDRWTIVEQSFNSPLTKRFVNGTGAMSTTTETSETVLVSSTETPEETLRPIEIHFSISGFAPNEGLLGVSFDGLEIIPTSV